MNAARIGNSVCIGWPWKACRRGGLRNEGGGWVAGWQLERRVPRVGGQLRIATPRGVALFMAAIDHRPATRGTAADTPLIAI